MKFHEIPAVIDTLVFDGDKSDLRLHYDNSLHNWGFDSEKDYEEQEKQINDFVIDNEYYTVYMWCDVSGYDYWIVRQEEGNYIQISVSFKQEDIPNNIIDQLKNDLDEAIYKAEDLENDWGYQKFIQKDLGN